MPRPPQYPMENLTDGEAWTVAGDHDRYHLTQCSAVTAAYHARALIVWDIKGPETLAGRRLCSVCAAALNVDVWPPR